jgi:hypothetical protein
MDAFRADVAKLLNAEELPSPPTSTKTPIMGKSECIAEQLNAYAKSKNANAPEYGAIFIDEGNSEGVRGDIAFCQSCLETGFFKFGGDVSVEQNNFCGLGAVGGGAKGASFGTPREGIRAQIQHLKAYVSKDALVNPCIDPRFLLVTRGIAPNWEDLNGRWAVPGNGYGENIVSLWKTAKGRATDTKPPKPPETPSTGFSVGDIVQFTSGAVYISSTVANPAHSRGKSRCKVTKAINAKHPYHLISEDNGGVYGWVDAVDVSAVDAPAPSVPAFQSYTVKVTTDALNIRKGAGTDYAVVGTIKDKGVYTIVAEANGAGASKWGKLKSGAGWISLDHAARK